VCERNWANFLKPPERQKIKKVLVMNAVFGWVLSSLRWVSARSAGEGWFFWDKCSERKGSERQRRREKQGFVGPNGYIFWLSLTLSVCFLGIAKGGKGEM
jgi:hypothetical protein